MQRGQLTKNFLFEKNFKGLQNPKQISKNIVIKTANSCHIFQMNFDIRKKTLNKENLTPNELFDTSADEAMSISAQLIDKDQKFFNKSNEGIVVNEFYQDIYTLQELKKNYKGFEYFMGLEEFEESFIMALKENKFELLIIKDLLLLNVTIKNYFLDSKTINLVIRPCTNMENIPDVFKNKSNNLANKDYQFKKNSMQESNNNISINKKAEIDNNSKLNHLLIGKKKLRQKSCCSNKHKKKIQIITTNNSQNSTSEADKSPSELLETTEITKNINTNLPEFESEALVYHSNIINEFEEETLIADAISNYSKKKYRLLYRASRDGDSAVKFHSMCDKYANLIILIKTKKGARFGGFTSAKFRSTSHLKFDNNAFLFSLDNHKVFKIIPGQYAIYCYENSGPCFAKGSLYIPNGFFKKCGKTSLAGGPYQFKKDYELNNGNEKFIVEELEVFQVKIDDIGL